MKPHLPDTFAGPGLFDLQVNGFGGFDFNSSCESWRPADFLRIQGALRRRGIVGALPTLITAAPEEMIARAERYAAILADAPELEICFPCLHVEGPFISPDEGPRGAHPQRHCRTPRDLPDLVMRMREASGERIGILTLAPELPGALALIEAATVAGICVALGHTQASPGLISEAVAAGARMSTHLGNGSHQLMPRLANYVQAQLAEDELTASFIADGHHIPWYTLKNFLRAKGPGRSVLVSDAIAGADAGPGLYRVGEQQVEVTRELRAQVPGQPNLAGSALTLDRAVLSITTHCGVPFPEAWEMASTRPAALIGLPPPERVSVRVSPDGCTIATDQFGSDAE